jgi:hypothetical protein
MNETSPPPALVPETDLACASNVVSSLGAKRLNCGMILSY